MTDVFDPTKTDDKDTTGGARGGGDDDSRVTNFQTRKFPWPGGARPKDPYGYQKVPEDIPMSKLSKEKSG